MEIATEHEQVWVYVYTSKSFFKYTWATSIRNKEAITVRNAIAHALINGYPEPLQSKNGKDF